MNVIKEEIVPYSRAKKILESAAEKRELGYEQNNALEYLKKFAKLSDKKVAELIEELGKIEKLKDRHRVLIADFLPEDMDDLRVLFANEVANLSEEDKKKILAVVKKFL